MGKFTMTHELRCEPEAFWAAFFDPEFNKQMYLQDLGFPAYEVVEHRETPTEIVHVVAGTPKMNVPGPVAKLMGANFSYREEGRFNKATSVWSWKVIPSAMADKMRHEGTMRIERAGEGKVRRIATIEIEAKIFGIGGLIESSTEKQLREGWDKSAGVLQRWLDAHK